MHDCILSIYKQPLIENGSSFDIIDNYCICVTMVTIQVAKFESTSSGICGRNLYTCIKASEKDHFQMYQSIINI